MITTEYLGVFRGYDNNTTEAPLVYEAPVSPLTPKSVVVADLARFIINHTDAMPDASTAENLKASIHQIECLAEECLAPLDEADPFKVATEGVEVANHFSVHDFYGHYQLLHHPRRGTNPQTLKTYSTMSQAIWESHLIGGSVSNLGQFVLKVAIYP